MVSVLRSLLLTLRTLARSPATLHLEILALRHQLEVLQRTRQHRFRLGRLRSRVPGSGRPTSSLRTTRSRLTGTVDGRLDVDLHLRVCVERVSVEALRRLKAIVFGVGSWQDGSAVSRDGPFRDMVAIGERQQHYASLGEGHETPDTAKELPMDYRASSRPYRRKRSAEQFWRGTLPVTV
jgi:hypothetical protein